MKRLMLPILSGLLVVAIGCANPADDAPEAVVQEPATAPDTTTPPAAATMEATTYTFTDDSKIEFVGSKVTGSHDGGFEEFEGTVRVNGEDLTTTRVDVTIDTTSVWSDNEQLTGHLKSDDFFGVETYPTATFETTAVSDNGDGTYTVTGNLELHGVTKQISFPAEIDLDGDSLSTKAEFSLKRFDFDIEYPGKADDLIRDEVLVKLDLEAEAVDMMDDDDEDEVDDDGEVG